LSSNSRIISAAAIAGLIALSFAVVSSIGLVTIPASYAVSSQTYYLDPTAGTNSCSGDMSLDYGTAPASASSVPFNPQDILTFCDPSIPAAVYTQNVTLVLYVASGVTGINFQAVVNDLTTATSQPSAVGSFSLPGSTCSSPTKVTLDLTVSPAAAYSAGDAIALVLSDYTFSGSFPICTGGSYASYMTINALPVTTVTSVSTSTTTVTSISTSTETTTSTVTSVSTTTQTSTIFVYATTTHVNCYPSRVGAGRIVYCKAVVRSTTIPIGTVTFGVVEGKFSGSSGPVTCTPIPSTVTCSAIASFKFQYAGNVIVSAAYSGDLTHQSSHGATLVRVYQ